MDKTTELAQKLKAKTTALIRRVKAQIDQEVIRLANAGVPAAGAAAADHVGGGIGFRSGARVAADAAAGGGAAAGGAAAANVPSYVLVIRNI